VLTNPAVVKGELRLPHPLLFLFASFHDIQSSATVEQVNGIGQRSHGKSQMAVSKITQRLAQANAQDMHCSVTQLFWTYAPMGKFVVDRGCMCQPL
jgi:hypothetical protein